MSRPHRLRPRAVIGLGVVLMMSFNACTGASEQPTASSNEPTGGPIEPTDSPVEPTAASLEPAASDVPAADVAAARQLIEASDLADPQTLNAIEGIRFTPAGEEASRGILASSPSGDILWAATWVYASSGTDAAPLIPLLENGDPSIRAMAAAALLALGERSAFAVLGAALSAGDHLRASKPPRSIGAFVVFTLSRYVQAADAPASPASQAELAAAEASWSAWLQAHASVLEFDALSGTWKPS